MAVMLILVLAFAPALAASPTVDYPSSRGPLNPTSLDDETRPVNWVLPVESLCTDNLILGCEFAGWKLIVTGSNNGSNPNYLYLLSWSGVLYDSIPQPTTSSYGWRDLAWDGAYLYAGDEGPFIQAFDLEGYLEPTLDIPKPAGISVVRGLAYDPANDRFWTSNMTSTLVEFDRAGNTLWSGPMPTTWSNIYGLAWQPWSLQGPILWAFSQTGTPTTTICGYNPVTHQAISDNYQIPLLSGLYSQTPGGLTYAPWSTYNQFIGIVQGTPQDMLFVYYPIEYLPPPAYLVLAPSAPLQTVPAIGGEVSYTATITAVVAGVYDVWVVVGMPNQVVYGPVLGPLTLNLPVGSLTRLRTLSVPAAAPPGYYAVMVRLGDYPSSSYDMEHFEFLKADTGTGPVVSAWLDTGEPFLERGTVPNVPPPLTSLVVTPNPFNPTTALSYKLRAASPVKLHVYDTSGKLVAEVVNGWKPAGTHSANFDGTELASGIYLARLEAGGITAVQKLVLLK